VAVHNGSPVNTLAEATVAYAELTTAGAVRKEDTTIQANSEEAGSVPEGGSGGGLGQHEGLVEVEEEGEGRRRGMGEREVAAEKLAGGGALESEELIFIGVERERGKQSGGESDGAGGLAGIKGGDAGGAAAREALPGGREQVCREAGRRAQRTQALASKIRANEHAAVAYSAGTCTRHESHLLRVRAIRTREHTAIREHLRLRPALPMCFAQPTHFERICAVGSSSLHCAWLQ
jgi:hypothetical protein